ncbi:hypothetical protein M427DRAFT_51333 [Gonapodya prolifera JEL478]|uniref:Uncharacterized protein n=1 Tax=Gonapodya prolifera (strain JEL478) TaxID=1344416 RepID=A0A139AZ33_GONPJ|nr:hypothetical protein M427DRAFT_51333 [Gonapodya prolifera JEL478]|eukprot:KXS21964.1 hypothetical protein M427DRAFT_51333 [Gonapodya prolifera JEL478]
MRFSMLGATVATLTVCFVAAEMEIPRHLGATNALAKGLAFTHNTLLVRSSSSHDGLTKRQSTCEPCTQWAVAW